MLLHVIDDSQKAGAERQAVYAGTMLCMWSNARWRDMDVSDEDACCYGESQPRVLPGLRRKGFSGNSPTTPPPLRASPQGGPESVMRCRISGPRGRAARCPRLLSPRIPSGVNPRPGPPNRTHLFCVPSLAYLLYTGRAQYNALKHLHTFPPLRRAALHPSPPRRWTSCGLS